MNLENELSSRILPSSDQDPRLASPKVSFLITTPQRQGGAVSLVGNWDKREGTTGKRKTSMDVPAAFLLV